MEHRAGGPLGPSRTAGVYITPCPAAPRFEERRPLKVWAAAIHPNEQREGHIG